MNRSELGKIIYEVAYLTGEFKLRSGKVSNEYFDKYRFEAQPKILNSIAEQLAPKIPSGTEVLAGLEMGGIPIATALSMLTGIPMVLVRKKAKDYGTCQFAEGLNIKGRQTLIIEDVVTTGGQVILSSQDLRSIGAKVDHVLSVIDRSQGHHETFKQNHLTFDALFTMEELKSLGRP